jgi:hypothetical protein
MHRLIVAFLAAFDAAIAVAVGIAAILAPLTLVWVFGLGDTADWGALWPASAVVWQLGHLVPLGITLPGDYLAATGIDLGAASFTLSLAPLAFATFTGIFAARSGSRASRADAWAIGVVTGTLVVGILATLIALTSENPLAQAELWQGIAFPTLIYAVPALLGALVTEWREAPHGLIARLRDRAEAWHGGWGEVIGVSARASAIAVVGLIGVGALVVAIALTARAGDIVALYEAGNVDLLGAIAVTLGQFAYLPTLVVWGSAFVAGPGFSLGEGSAVSPSGTQVGVVPGVPILGAVPESTSSWLLLLALLPVAIGALAGWVARSRLLDAAGFLPATRAPRRMTTDASADELVVLSPGDDPRRSTLESLLAKARQPDFEPSAEIVEPVEPPRPVASGHEPFLPRLVVTVAIAGIAAGVAALLSAFASGSAGPGRLAEVGPSPGPVALAVGVEVLVGAGILLHASRRRAGETREAHRAAGSGPRAETGWAGWTTAPSETGGPRETIWTSGIDREDEAPARHTDDLAPAPPVAEPEAITAPVPLPSSSDTPPERPWVD